MFQQLLANKHRRLRDAKFGRVEVWVCSSTKQKQKNKTKQRVNQDPRRPMAARLKIIISRAIRLYKLTLDVRRMTLLVSLIFVFGFNVPNFCQRIPTSSMCLCDLKSNPRHFRYIVVALKIEKFYLRE